MDKRKLTISVDDKRANKVIELLEIKYPDFVSHRDIFFLCTDGEMFSHSVVYNAISRTRKLLAKHHPQIQIITSNLGRGYKLYYPIKNASN